MYSEVKGHKQQTIAWITLFFQLWFR